MSPKGQPSQSTQAVGTTTPKQSIQNWIAHAVQTYGDLLYDLCESVLWSPNNAPFAFRAIIKDLKKNRSSNPFQDYERAWVLQIACQRLRKLALGKARRLTPPEQIMLDSTQNIDSRIRQFDSYFHRLTTDEQILLLLRDKYGIPYPEISTAMAIPEDSIKMRRQQALRTLEEWLWSEPA